MNTTLQLEISVASDKLPLKPPTKHTKNLKFSTSGTTCVSNHIKNHHIVVWTKKHVLNNKTQNHNLAKFSQKTAVDIWSRFAQGASLPLARHLAQHEVLDRQPSPGQLRGPGPDGPTVRFWRPQGRKHIGVLGRNGWTNRLCLWSMLMKHEALCHVDNF